MTSTHSTLAYKLNNLLEELIEYTVFRTDKTKYRMALQVITVCGGIMTKPKLYDLYRSRVGADVCLPFVGDDFQDSAKKAFRVLVVGLNAHLADSNWESPGIPKPEAPSWSSGWWRELTHKLHADGRLAALVLAERAIDFDVFTSLAFNDPESTLFLNFIPRYLTSVASSSSGVKDSDFTGAADLWKEILDLLATEGVFPNAILVLGRSYPKVWDPIWQSLHESHCQSSAYSPAVLRDELDVAAYCRVMIGNKITPLLLYRAPHPAARNYASPAGNIYRWFLQGAAATLLSRTI